MRTRIEQAPVQRMFLPIAAGPTFSDTNGAAAEHEFNVTVTVSRLFASMYGVKRWRFVYRVAVAGPAGYQVKVQWSLDETNWTDLSSGYLAADAIGIVTTSWETLPIAARGTDVFFRMVAINGNGVADPGTRWAGIETS